MSKKKWSFLATTMSWAILPLMAMPMTKKADTEAMTQNLIMMAKTKMKTKEATKGDVALLPMETPRSS